MARLPKGGAGKGGVGVVAAEPDAGIIAVGRRTAGVGTFPPGGAGREPGPSPTCQTAAAAAQKMAGPRRGKTLNLTPV